MSKPPTDLDITTRSGREFHCYYRTAVVIVLTGRDFFYEAAYRVRQNNTPALAV